MIITELDKGDMYGNKKGMETGIHICRCSNNSCAMFLCAVILL